MLQITTAIKRGQLPLSSQNISPREVSPRSWEAHSDWLPPTWQNIFILFISGFIPRE